MSEDEIKKTILSELYRAYFLSNGAVNLYELQTTRGWNITEFQKVIDRLSHDSLITPWGGNYRIKSNGVIEAERLKISDPKLTDSNNDIRTKLLVQLGQVYKEKGKLAFEFIENLAEILNVDKYLLTYNIQVLDDCDYVEQKYAGGVNITYKGLERIADYEKRILLVEEFKKISELAPRPRGRALQKLLAKILEQQKWPQEEGVTTTNEEMDVIIHRDREYYLIECKWEKDPIEASVIRELHGKLANREGVRGIVWGKMDLMDTKVKGK